MHGHYGPWGPMFLTGFGLFYQAEEDRARREATTDFLMNKQGGAARGTTNRPSSCDSVDSLGPIIEVQNICGAYACGTFIALTAQGGHRRSSSSFTATSGMSSSTRCCFFFFFSRNIDSTSSTGAGVAPGQRCNEDTSKISSPLTSASERQQREMYITMALTWNSGNGV